MRELVSAYAKFGTAPGFPPAAARNLAPFGGENVKMDEVREARHNLRGGLNALKLCVSAFDILLLTGAQTPDDVAQDVVRAIYENFEQLKEDYPPLRAGEREKVASTANTVPYHPGAVAFFKEAGLWTEANDERDETLAR